MNNFEYLFSKVFGEVRYVVDDKGEVWFAATDIARALGDRDAKNTARIVAEEDKGTHIVSTLGGTQELLFINESGLYQVILTKKPKDEKKKLHIKQFKKWITSEVLPAIREDGMYIHGEENMTKEELDRAKEEYYEKKVMRKFGIGVRKDFTKELKKALDLDNEDGIVYAKYTNAIYETLFNMKANDLKSLHGLNRNGVLRDAMNSKLLDAVSEAERTVITLIKMGVTDVDNIQLMLGKWWSNHKIKYKNQ